MMAHYFSSNVKFHFYYRLLCIYVKKPSIYPQSTDQISGGIWYGVPKAKKIEFFCHLTFVIHIQRKLYVKDKFCTLLYFNYTSLNVNYMLSNKYCTLLKVDYMFDVNCKLSSEYFMLLNRLLSLYGPWNYGPMALCPHILVSRNFEN